MKSIHLLTSKTQMGAYMILSPAGLDTQSPSLTFLTLWTSVLEWAPWSRDLVRFPVHLQNAVQFLVDNRYSTWEVCVASFNQSTWKRVCESKGGLVIPWPSKNGIEWHCTVRWALDPTDRSTATDQRGMWGPGEGK